MVVASNGLDNGPTLRTLLTHGHPCRSHFATSRAWYVRIMSAPARLMLVRVSSTIRRSSIQPLAAAALTMAYSPETL